MSDAAIAMIDIVCPKCGERMGSMSKEGNETGFRCACGGNVRQLGLELVCCNCDAVVVAFECCERGSP